MTWCDAGGCRKGCSSDGQSVGLQNRMPQVRFLSPLPHAAPLPIQAGALRVFVGNPSPRRAPVAWTVAGRCSVDRGVAGPARRCRPRSAADGALVRTAGEGLSVRRDPGRAPPGCAQHGIGPWRVPSGHLVLAGCFLAGTASPPGVGRAVLCRRSAAAVMLAVADPRRGAFGRRARPPPCRSTCGAACPDFACLPVTCCWCPSSRPWDGRSRGRGAGRRRGVGRGRAGGVRRFHARRAGRARRFPGSTARRGPGRVR